MTSLSAGSSADATVSQLKAQSLRERAEIARLQAEIASASTSLEHGKNNLETSLISSPLRAVNRGNAVASVGADDDAVSRSLQAQILATREGLAELEARELVLRAEVHGLARRGGSLSPLRAGWAGVLGNGAGGFGRSVESARKVLRDAAGREGKEGGTGEGLNWREHSLPSLTLIGVEGGRRECVMSGVVVDRVFDGIVAFTSGRDRMVNGTSALTSIPSASKDYEIVSCAEAVEELGVEGVAATVASQYSAMTVEGVQGDQVRIVSVTSTLDCVRRMLEPHVAAALDAAATTKSEDLFDAFARSDAAKRPADEPDGGPRVFRAASEPARAVASGSADLLTPRLSHASKCMPDACFAKLLSAAPVRYHESDLQRLYCTNTDGISLATLLSKVSGRSPIFIVVRDTSNRAFGCYGSTSWRNSCTRSYGSGECFVFKQNGQSVDVFKWTRANKFFQWSSHEHLAIGGGGHFALWLDTDLASGTTAVCSTFGNPPLTTGRRSLTAITDDNVGVNMGEMVDFEIVVIEAWVPVLRGHLPSG